MQALRVWLIVLALASTSIVYAEPPPLPAPPTSYVLDEPGVLDAKTLGSLQALLSRQDSVTGEQVVFAIFKTLSHQDLVTWTNQVFQHWKIGQKGKDNGVLLALYWQDHKARIEVGYGLESRLTDAKSKWIINEYLIPELKSNHPNAALTLTAIQILKTLNSPLIQNGEAEKILQQGGNPVHLTNTPLTSAHPLVWWLLGFILFFLFFRIFFVGDSHFTRGNEEGSHNSWTGKNRRFRNRSRWWWGGGGGGFGGGGWGGGDGNGGGGGFSGGGGSSGGGGASGDW